MNADLNEHITIRRNKIHSVPSTCSTGKSRDRSKLSLKHQRKKAEAISNLNTTVDEWTTHLSDISLKHQTTSKPDIDEYVAQLEFGLKTRLVIKDTKNSFDSLDKMDIPTEKTAKDFSFDESNMKKSKAVPFLANSHSPKGKKMSKELTSNENSHNQNRYSFSDHMLFSSENSNCSELFKNSPVENCMLQTSPETPSNTSLNVDMEACKDLACSTPLNSKKIDLSQLSVECVDVIPQQKLQCNSNKNSDSIIILNISPKEKFITPNNVQDVGSKFVTPLKITNTLDSTAQKTRKGTSVASKKKQVISILLSSSSDDDDDNCMNVNHTAPRLGQNIKNTGSLVYNNHAKTEPRQQIEYRSHDISSSDEENSLTFENFLIQQKPNAKSHTKKKLNFQKQMEYRSHDISSSDDENSLTFENFLIQQKPNAKSHTKKKLHFQFSPIQNLIVSDGESIDENDEPSLDESLNTRLKKKSRNKINNGLKPLIDSNTNGVLSTGKNRKQKIFEKNVTEEQEENLPTFIPNKLVQKFPVKCGVFGKTNQLSFLASLSVNAKVELCHPDSFIYKEKFKKNRDELTSRLYKKFNGDVFDNKLPPDLDIKWNPRLTKTAGLCYTKKDITTPLGRTARLELSCKVLDSAERVRDTLLHELCHAASWLIHGVRDGHGPIWKHWASRVMRCYPELPVLSRCHNYDISTKYVYQCVRCGYKIGRHSKSLDVNRKMCKICGNRFELKQTTAPNQTPRSAGKFALFVKDHYKELRKKNEVNHSEMMKLLSAEFNQKFKLANL